MPSLTTKAAHHSTKPPAELVGHRHFKWTSIPSFEVHYYTCTTNDSIKIETVTNFREFSVRDEPNGLLAFDP